MTDIPDKRHSAPGQLPSDTACFRDRVGAAFHSDVTSEMLTSGHISLDRGENGVPFQEIGPGVFNFWHPETLPRNSGQIDAATAAEMRRRVELGHGSWQEIAVLYGFSERLSEFVYPLCGSEMRFELVCKELAMELAKAIHGHDEAATAEIIDVIYERKWYRDFVRGRAAAS
jgi:hypothetical protein